MSETSRNKTGTRNTASSRSSSSRQASAGRSSSQKNYSDRSASAKSARSAGGTTTAGRSRNTSAKRRRKRRQGPDFAKILLILIGIVIAILCVAVGLKGCGKEESEKVKENPTKATEAKEPETEIQAEITVNGISINGLTKSEAMEKILADIGWDMQVTYNGETKPVSNLLVYNVDEVLETALGNGKAGTYEVNGDGLEERVVTEAEAIAYEWDVQPKNGSISSYDKASGEFVFSKGEVGRAVDREKLADEIQAALNAGEYQKKIAVTVNEIQPEITEAQAKESFKRLGTYTTTTTNNSARNENVRIASEAINGMIIQPGEEFSFNLTTGNRTPDKGYKPAGAYVNGVLVEEPGGGVCQVSSTLYNAVVFAGLKTTERHAHSYEPSYVTPGEDAMVSYDGHSGPDMKFINNSKTAVGIKTSFSNLKLTVSVYGSPILEDGVTLSMVSTKVKDLEPPAPVYEEDQTLEPGVEVEAKAATLGSRWATNLVTKKDGVVINEIHFHNSTYKGKSATIKRNTSGVVIPAPTQASEAPSAEESTAAAENPAPTPAEPTTGTVSGPAGSAETNAQVPSDSPKPSGATEQTSGTQQAGPADLITPSVGGNGGPGSSPASGPTPGASSNPPQSPADMSSPANTPAGVPSNVPSGVPAQNATPGGPGSQNAEVNAGPGNVGLISPIG